MIDPLTAFSRRVTFNGADGDPEELLDIIEAAAWDLMPRGYDTEVQAFAERAWGLVGEYLDPDHGRAEIFDRLQAVSKMQAPGWGEPDVPCVYTTEPLTPDHLPDFLAPFVRTVAESYQVAPEMVAVPSFAVLALTQAGRTRLALRPGWTEEVTLYGAVVAPPATRKSAVFEIVTRPVREYEERTLERVGQRRRVATDAVEVAEKELESTKRAVAEGKATLEELEDRRRRLDEARAKVPPRPKLLVSDSTPEAALKLLAENGGAVGMLNPEGDTLLSFDGRYSKGGGLQGELLKKGYTCEAMDSLRVERGEVRVPRPALAVGIMTQPGQVESLRNADAMRDQGILGRFLWAVPETNVGHRLNGWDAPVLDEHAVAVFHSVVTRLLEGRIPEVSPENSGDFGYEFPGSTIRTMRLSKAAEATARRWGDEYERRLAVGGEWSPIQDWGGKAAGHALRLSCLFHLGTMAYEGAADVYAGEVSEGAVDMAFKVVDTLSTHALQQLSGNWSNGEEALLAYLLDRIREIGAPVSVNKLGKRVRGKKALGTVDDRMAHLEKLEARDCIRLVQWRPNRPGHPGSPTIHLHPAFAENDTRNTRNSENREGRDRVA